MTPMALVREGEHIGVRELRENLAKVLKSRKTYFVTDHGKPVRAVLPYETFLELLEIMEELRDKALVGEVTEGRKEYRKGGWVPSARLRKSLRSP
jgi:prevent-host-death family protein